MILIKKGAGNEMEIYEKVLNAMQEAEELGGPRGDEYMRLMTNIATEALTRMQTYRSGSYVEDLKKELEPKPIKTFEEFRKTGRNVRFKDAGIDTDTEFGRVYDLGCYIELCDDGQWLLTIERSEWMTNDLIELERRLYNDWYRSELVYLHRI